MELNKEQIARVCHEANRAYCMVLGDHTQPGWDQSPVWMTESALKGVDEALKGATPKQLHEAWCAAKVADGWKLGPVKAPELKEHPCLVPYDQLPQEQKVKDELFHAVVKALAPMLPLIDTKAFLALPRESLKPTVAEVVTEVVKSHADGVKGKKR